MNLADASQDAQIRASNLPRALADAADRSGQRATGAAKRRSPIGCCLMLRKADGALATRKLPKRTSPVFNMIRPSDLPVLEHVHVNRHDVEAAPLTIYAEQWAGGGAGSSAAHGDGVAISMHRLYGPFEVGDEFREATHLTKERLA